MLGMISRRFVLGKSINGYEILNYINKGDMESIKKMDVGFLRRRDIGGICV
jgi:hypothetical protein